MASPCLADDCAPEPQGEGRVSSVIDARTLRLDDGRLIRLAGLAPLRGAQSEVAAAALAKLAIGRTISLNGESDTPDRYGRQRVWAFAVGDSSSLQTLLIAAGAGVRDVARASIECRRSLELAEITARKARLGLWANSKGANNGESPDDISTEIGHFSVVEGQVRSVRTSGGSTYLNFGRRWIDGFAVMVPARAISGLEAAGLMLKGLEGKRLRVRGYILRRGGFRIEVLSPGQIEMVDAGDVAIAGTRIDDDGDDGTYRTARPAGGGGARMRLAFARRLHRHRPV